MTPRLDPRRGRARIAVALLVLAVCGTLAYSAAAWVPSDANSGNAFATSPHFPSIVLTPALGLRGIPITITGSGFAPTSNLTVTFAGSATPWTSGGGTVTTNGSGAIPALSTIAAGSQGPGTWTVKVTDAVGDYATATFQLLS